MKRTKRRVTGVGAGFVLFVVFIACYFTLKLAIGSGGWGPTQVQTITVQRTYVDVGNSGKKPRSHYMVVTDGGVFEVDNGLFLRVWNADEIYGRLEAGKQYEITTKGNRVVNMLFQEYPYIVRVSGPVPPPLEAPSGK